MGSTIKLEISEGMHLKELWEVPKKDFKQEFLKMFGNIVKKGTNKGMEDKEIIKSLVYKSKSLDEMICEINRRTRWSVYVRY